MRPVLLVLGVLIALIGGVWALQGSGFLLGSFMSNDPTWLWIGIGTVVLGGIPVVIGYRSTPAAKGK